MGEPQDSDRTPLVSIVTPCHHQTQSPEEAILSVLNQRYLNREYLVIDGGSTDGSIDIICNYSSRLAYRVSEPDKDASTLYMEGTMIAARQAGLSLNEIEDR